MNLSLTVFPCSYTDTFCRIIGFMSKLSLLPLQLTLPACEARCDVTTHRKLHIKLVREGDKHPQPQAAPMRVRDGRWNNPRQRVNPSQEKLTLISFWFFLMTHTTSPDPPTEKKVTPWTHFPLGLIWGSQEFPFVAHTLTLHESYEVTPHSFSFTINLSQAGRVELGWKWDKKIPCAISV